MLQKTEMSEASTAVEQKITSFFTPKNREMFRPSKKGEAIPNLGSISRISKDMIPNDLLYLEPKLIKNLAWP